MIRTIAWRELRSLFLSPLAFVILGLTQVILARLFLGHVNLFLTIQAQLVSIANPPGLTALVVAPLLGNMGVLLLLITPLITMRLIANERHNGTLTLLYSAPVSMTEIILGKYLGILGFFFIIVALTLAMPLSLLMGGQLDWGMFGCGVLGLLLFTSTLAAVGLFMSTLTKHPAVAAMGTFGVLFLLWVIDYAGHAQGTGGYIVAYLSIVNHYEPFLRGFFDSSNAVYFVTLSVSCLILSIRRLDADRMDA
ncbi:MAG TPA: ABC transporter permease subunit [Acidiferrobacter sp.]|nr:ABC transporter permease subunit [Acidiferrobacter sp.]